MMSVGGVAVAGLATLLGYNSNHVKAEDEKEPDNDLCATCGDLIDQEHTDIPVAMTSLQASLHLGKFVVLMLGTFVTLVNLSPRLISAAIYQAGLVGYLVVLWAIIVVAVWACQSGLVGRVVRWALGLGR